MNKCKTLLLSLLVAQSAMGFDARLDFALTVSPLEWELQRGNIATPILILWNVKNKTDRRVILPTGTPISLQLTDEDGKIVPGGEARDGFVAFSYQDYKQINPGWSIYCSGGDLSLYSEKDRLYIGGPTMRGGWIRYGPLHRGKYSLKCSFSTVGDPSAYAKKAGWISELWLGQVSGEALEISVK